MAASISSCPKSPSTDVNAWEFNGNRCGNGVGIWELDRVSLGTMASGSGRPVRGPHQRDITAQTRTRNAAGTGTPQEPMPQRSDWGMVSSQYFTLRAFVRRRIAQL